MSYHIQIQGIRPNAQVRELFEYLEKLTGDDPQTLISRLKSPPFDLPDLADQGLLQKHLVEIRKFGGVARIQQANKPAFAEPQKSTPANPPNDETGESRIAAERRKIAEAYLNAEAEKEQQQRKTPDHVEASPTKLAKEMPHESPTPSSTSQQSLGTMHSQPIPKTQPVQKQHENKQHQHTHHEHAHHEHELPSPFAASGSRKKKPQQSQLKTLSILLGALALFIAVSVYLSNQPKKATSAESDSSRPTRQTSNTGDNTAQSNNSKAPKQNLQQRRQQTQEANSLYEKSMRASNPVIKEKLLRETVSKNPYHSKAWEDLVKNLRKNGKFEEAETMEKLQQEQNIKVRKALQSIAETFGSEGQKEVDINPAKVNVSVSSNQSMKPQEFYQRGFGVWQQVNQKHPEKEFELKRTGRSSYSMQTRPGADYPAYQDWKKKQR